MDNNNLADAADEWAIPSIEMEPETDQYRLLAGLIAILDDLDTHITELYDQRFIDTASGAQLEMLADAVGLSREIGEDDDTLRQRTKVRYLTRSSTGTFDDVAKVAEAVFASSNFSIDTAEDMGGGNIRIVVSTDVLDNTIYSQPEAADAISDALPPTHDASIGSEDTFVFSSDGNVTGAGFGEGIWASTSN